MFFRFFRTRISKQCSIYFHLASISPFTKRFKFISNVVFATVIIFVTLCSAVGAKHITTVCSSVFCRKDSQPQACISTVEFDPFFLAYYLVLVTYPRWKIKKDIYYVNGFEICLACSPILWLALKAGKMIQMATRRSKRRLGTTHSFPKETFPKLVRQDGCKSASFYFFRVRGLRLFLLHKYRKKKLGRIPAILTPRLVNNPNILPLVVKTMTRPQSSSEETFWLFPFLFSCITGNRLHLNTPQCKIHIVPEEGCSGQPKYSTPSKKSFCVLSVLPLYSSSELLRPRI